MTDYLVYWKTYWDQTNGGADASGSGGWFTNSEWLHRAVAPGDRLWVVIANDEPPAGRWLLLSSLWVARPGRTTAKTRWGRFEIVGDDQRSMSFMLEGQPDFTAVLWLLHFTSGKRIATVGRKIGQMLQTARQLTHADMVLLSEYAAALTRQK